MEMKTRPVLTINQVYEIISKYIECKDWLKAFQSTLPKRKGAQPQQKELETSPLEEVPVVENDQTPSTSSLT